MTSRITRLTARAVFLPMNRSLTTATGAITQVPFVLVDLETSAGATGRSYLFCITPAALKATVAALDDIAPLVVGHSLSPVALSGMLEKRFTLLGTTGIIGMALAGIDMAAWDAKAIEGGLPLARLLGGELRPVAAYNSCGLGLMGPEKVAREAGELLAGGFRALKLRLGYATLEEDLAAARAVKAVLPPGTALMSDYNQALDPTEAIRRGRALDEMGLTWIEEPVRAEDHAGCARVAAALATPVSIGENYWGPRDMARAVAAQASDYVMPDAMRIGGVSGWLRAAAIADAAALPMSTHLFPEVSAHLMCVTPTAHWLEYVDWINPVLTTPLAMRDGHAVPADLPGCGITWDEAAVARYAFS
ncbi:MAG: mandelate racemase [Burkholderiales bacterium]|nr:mandelate racemase [Burkholderiales bacterium]